MSKNQEKLLGLTKLRYKNDPLLLKSFDNDEGIYGEILRVHLLTEFYLEELIRHTLDENAEAVLSVGLKYNQKLNLASNLKLIEDFELLPDYIVGSLRKLNKLRNRVAHQLNVPVEESEIKELFVGLEEELPYGSVTGSGLKVALKRYLYFVYGHMFPKYELADESI
jgi:hypothetical protein